MEINLFICYDTEGIFLFPFLFMSQLMLISAKNEYKYAPSAVVASRNFTKDICTQSCKSPAVLVNPSVLSDAKKRILKAS
jgi:hypothetical protein